VQLDGVADAVEKQKALPEEVSLVVVRDIAGRDSNPRPGDHRAVLKVRWV